MEANILVVDDTPENLRLLMRILEEQGYEVRPASDGLHALSTAYMDPPDLILLDIRMPEMDGYDVCERLKADPRTRAIPVIFISALHEVTNKIKGFSLGGVDFISKPFQPEEVLARVQTHLTIRQLQRQLQEQNTRLEAQNLALEEQNARFQTLSDATFEGIVIHDNGRIVDVNQKFEEISGYRRTELIGKPVLDVVVPEFRNTVAAWIQIGNNRPREIQGLRKDGSVFPMEIQAKTMPYQGRDITVVALRDLSQQKAMEAQNKQLQHENVTLKASMKERYRFGALIGRSPAMQKVYELITKTSATDAHVVIYGESGTGKDLIAQTIHQLSKRRKQPFVPVNCGSIQETLFESEFFGHLKGAFTGAYKDKSGLFDAAHTGTLFLDEIGELPLTMQVKLLRAIEGKGYTPVGDHRVKYADVRIIAATNRNLKAQIKQGMLREDFFYRINVITISVPPLRERREDIPLLVEHFLTQYRSPETPQRLPAKILDALYHRDWPGNIRQLQNALQRYVTLKRLNFGEQEDEPGPMTNDDIFQKVITHAELGLWDILEDLEKRVIAEILEQTHGNLSKAARTLRIPRRTLRRRIEKYQLK